MPKPNDRHGGNGLQNKGDGCNIWRDGSRLPNIARIAGIMEFEIARTG